ncbi:hypothetical protein [Mycobacterium leprae]|uniref:hypothetical protein n=1 Tax=Mycobacterium leprae TaxID=1769 RepID=UPI0002FE3F4F|nr:hypothetical protein [Mycobacterium leprae]
MDEVRVAPGVHQEVGFDEQPVGIEQQGGRNPVHELDQIGGFAGARDSGLSCSVIMVACWS